ncbi:MAG: GTPase [Moorella sp. (in: firmicutes)]|uniref:ribosome biogenesis GTPase Der n=1 Tax=unclassified Neomoorella TaxID=2676739 RepID=UPI0010FFAD57|nr:MULTISPECIES: ribosome biogenesis GTPase Der [unclassified Moorella (in: firmicutes)]MDK2816697.1 GTPase [Moorella sp. (in: firmicutes)]MDK2894636.1 GTPase [Moorella sp. (in: firmicutes)]GEA15764.1 GTPase Der [Moorella sp. E308F]GEA19405.1 GTPase Der [Moorella sp. E306M]
MPKPVVAIVGRPNVGKSTLFNRITGARVAIVEDTPGVTRDRLYHDADWRGRQFTLVDTGGIAARSDDPLVVQVRRQAETALEEADVILFVVDARTGLTADDDEVAELLRRSGRPVILVANKVEDFSDPTLIHEFYRLGLGDPLPISAIHGLNIGDLLDRIVDLLPESAAEEDGMALKVAVVGRPNVGKSSIVNRLLGEERVIVSELPGTTRDAIDTYIRQGEREYILIDTAGMRRKSRIADPTEHYSVLRALKAVERADVVLVVLDGTEGVTEQDKKIAGYGHEQGKASIIIVNKWDLVPKDDKTMARYEEMIREELSFMSYAPILFISALTGQRVGRILPAIDAVGAEASRHVATSTLNSIVQEAVMLTPPPAVKGQAVKIFYATQVKVNPPTFIFFCNRPEDVHFSYQRYLENQLRQAFGFEGTPLRLLFRRSKGQ